MADWDKQPIVVIGGPTASGKTGFSVELAKRFDGEIICADSMQIYDGLDVGTAKVTREEAQGVPHHLVGFLRPEENYSVANYVEDAAKKITETAQRNHIPFVVGGTGLYIESLVKGVRFSENRPTPGLRRQLEEKAARVGREEMLRELKEIDPEYAATLHPNNEARIIRALELYYSSGVTMTEQRRNSLPERPPYHALILCLDWPREELYRRIDLRVNQMLKQGILEEAKLVYENRQRYKTAAQAIGYKEFFPYFENEASLERCADALKQASRHYAKRQLTWFRRMEQVVWIPAQAPDALIQAEQRISEHLSRK